MAETADKALRSIHDHHERTGSDDSQRLVDSISSSYEQTWVHEKEASQSLQETESLSGINEYIKRTIGILQSGRRIQEFVEWMQKQPAPWLS